MMNLAAPSFAPGTMIVPQVPAGVKPPTDAVAARCTQMFNALPYPRLLSIGAVILALAGPQAAIAQSSATQNQAAPPPAVGPGPAGGAPAPPQSPAGNDSILPPWVRFANTPVETLDQTIADAKAALDRKDYSKAVELLSPLARVGNAQAQANLGYVYANGLGVPKDYKEAVRWYRLAAEQGYARAQADLGLAYHFGQGVPKDYKESVRWYRLAAEQGEAQAQAILGLVYANGLGVPKDYKEAVRWYRLAAEQGEAQAQADLGYAYANGLGVPKDYKEAVRWHRLAAEQGNALAQANLGYAYANGLGVPKDYVSAYKWFNLTAASETSAFANFAAEERDKVAALMTPAQIAEAQRLSSQWKPTQTAEGSGSDAVAEAPPNSGQPAAPGEAQAGAFLGSGFFVSADGRALTNAHVVDGCAQIRVTTAAGAGTARLLARDGTNDLALLATSLRPAATATLRPGVRQGEDIAIYGFPLSGLLADSGAITTGTVAALAGPGDDSRLLQITAPVQPGNSGGPVLDRSGNVVGVVVSKLDALRVAALTQDIPQNVNFAIKTSVARSFLDVSQDIPKGEPGIAPLSTPDIAARARAFTIHVECDRPQ